MRHVSVDPPPFFHRGPSPLARLAFFGVLSLALLFADTRYRYLEGVRQAVSVVLYPVQRALELPGAAFSYVADYFGSKRELSDDNARLKQDLVAKAPAVQEFALLRTENQRLKGLMELKSRYPGGGTAVEVLYSGRDPFSQKLYVDKGSTEGVQAGSAVIDETGVVGQVTRVLPQMSEITLVTDKDHAVPVRVERSGVRSVMYGNGTGRAPELRFMAPTADIKVGDHLLTSGIDGIYPAGLAVAEVVEMDRDTGQMFARIACRPLAGVDRAQFLLVLQQATPLPPRPDAPADDAAKKAPRGKGRRG